MDSPAQLSTLVEEFFHSETARSVPADLVGDDLEVTFALSIEPREAVRAATLAEPTMAALRASWAECTEGAFAGDMCFRNGDMPLDSDDELLSLLLEARLAHVVPQIGVVPADCLFSDVDALSKALLAAGVDASLWAVRGGATAHQLQRELESGTSVMVRGEGDALLRRVFTVYVLLYNADRSAALVRADSTASAPADAMLPYCRFSRYASAYGAGLGALESETGIRPASVVPLGFQNPGVSSRESHSYGGLTTQYHVDMLELQLEDASLALPDGWVWSAAAARTRAAHAVPENGYGGASSAEARRGLAVMGYLSGAGSAANLLGPAAAASSSAAQQPAPAPLPPAESMEPHQLEAWLLGAGVDTSRYGTGGAKTVADLLRELRKGECEIVVEEDDGGVLRPLRVVKVAKATIRHPSNPDLMLVETHEMIRDSVRVVHKTLSEKFLPSETTWTTVRRGIDEEILQPVRRGYVIMGEELRVEMEDKIRVAGGTVEDPAEPAGGRGGRVSAAPERRARALNLVDADDNPINVRAFNNEDLISAERLSLLSVSAPVIEYNDSPSYPGLRSKYCLHAMEVHLDLLPSSSFSTLEGRNIHFWAWRRISDVHIMKKLQNRVAFYMHLALKLSRNRGAETMMERYLFEAAENNDTRALELMLDSWADIMTKLRSSEKAREIDATRAAAKQQLVPGSAKGRSRVLKRDPIADPLDLVDRSRTSLVGKAASCGPRCAAVTELLIERTLRRAGILGKPLRFGGALAARHATAASDSGLSSPISGPSPAAAGRALRAADESKGVEETKAGGAGHDRAHSADTGLQRLRDAADGAGGSSSSSSAPPTPGAGPQMRRIPSAGGMVAQAAVAADAPTVGSGDASTGWGSLATAHCDQVAVSRSHAGNFVNLEDVHGHSLLYFASMANSRVAVSRLLGLGADPNSACPMCMVRAGCLDALEMLLPQLRPVHAVAARTCGHPVPAARDRRYFQALLGCALSDSPAAHTLRTLSLVLRQCNPSLGFFSRYMRSFLVLVCVERRSRSAARAEVLELARNSTHSLHTALDMSRLLRRMLQQKADTPSMLLSEMADDLEGFVADVLSACGSQHDAGAMLAEPCSAPAWTPALSLSQHAALSEQAHDTLLEMVVRGHHKRVASVQYFQSSVRRVWHGDAHETLSRYHVPGWRSLICVFTLALLPFALLAAAARGWLRGKRQSSRRLGSAAGPAGPLDAVLAVGLSPQFKFWLSGVMQAGFCALLAGVIWEGDLEDTLTALEVMLFLFGCGMGFDFALSVVLMRRQALHLYENRINFAIVLGLFVTLCAREDNDLYSFMLGVDTLLAAYKLIYLIGMAPSTRLGRVWFAVSGVVVDVARYLVVLAPIVAAYTVALYADTHTGAMGDDEPEGFSSAKETFETVAWTAVEPFRVNAAYFDAAHYWIVHMWFLNICFLGLTALLFATVVDRVKCTRATFEQEFAFATAQLAFHYRSASSWPSPTNLLAWLFISAAELCGRGTAVVTAGSSSQRQQSRVLSPQTKMLRTRAVGAWRGSESVSGSVSGDVEMVSTSL